MFLVHCWRVGGGLCFTMLVGVGREKEGSMQEKRIAAVLGYIMSKDFGFRAFYFYNEFRDFVSFFHSNRGTKCSQIDIVANA